MRPRPIAPVHHVGQAPRERPHADGHHDVQCLSPASAASVLIVLDPVSPAPVAVEEIAHYLSHAHVLCALDRHEGVDDVGAVPRSLQVTAGAVDYDQPFSDEFSHG
eukprot:1995625-Pyramimonas_sp.AAC.1